jgi:alanyl-tRNA synthetase
VRVREAAELLKVAPDEMIQRLAAIIDERRKLERQLAEAKRELALMQTKAQVHTSAIAGDQSLAENVIFKVVTDVSSKDLRGMVDAYKTNFRDGVFTVLTKTDDKVSFVVGVAGNFATANSASNIAQQVSEVFGGKGGGRVDFAQGGGPNVERLSEAEQLFDKLVIRPAQTTKKSADTDV